MNVAAVLAVALKRDRRVARVDATVEGLFQYQASVKRTLVQGPTERIARAVLVAACEPKYVRDFRAMEVNRHV